MPRKRKQADEKPKVPGQVVSEPLSEQEIKEREEEAKKDAPPPAKPKKKKKISALVKQKQEEEKAALEAEMEAQEAEKFAKHLKDECEGIFATLKAFTENHEEAARDHGFGSIANQFKSLRGMAKTLQANISKSPYFRKKGK